MLLAFEPIETIRGLDKVNSETKIVYNTHPIVPSSTGNSEKQILATGGKHKDRETVLKALQKVYDTDTLKVINVEKFEEVREMRWMPEDYYIRHSARMNEPFISNEGEEE